MPGQSEPGAPDNGGETVPPDGVPVSSPRKVWMTEVNGWCAANHCTEPDIWCTGTNALPMNGSS